jgi:hypothetical protein
VSKKKTARKRKTAGIPSVSLSSEDKDLLNNLLQNLAQIDPSRIRSRIPRPELAQAIVESMPLNSPETVTLVTAIQEAFDHKGVQKAAKRIIFKLKQRGLAVPERESEKVVPSVLKKEAPEPDAAVGPIDGVGGRGVFLAVPQVPHGIDVALGLISDEIGLIEFIYGRYSRKRMREVKEFFFDNFHHMVATSAAHVATVLEKAFGHNEHSTTDSTRQYLQFRPWIRENITLLERAPAYDYISSESIFADVLTHSQTEKLLSHELMHSWIVETEKVRPVVEEISEADRSPILVSDSQKTDRVEEIKKAKIEELYPDAKRLTLKWRLEEMAYVFYRLDEEEFARLALSAAASLEKKESIFGVNPFLKALLERSLAYYEQMSSQDDMLGKREEGDPSCIILP